MPGIVTLTLNPAVDKSCTVDQVAPEKKLRCREVHHEPGGGGINVARAVGRLGGEATAYWTCGGALGALLNNLLDEEGIEHRPLPIGAMTRENVTVSEESSGQQFRFAMPGAPLTEEEVQSCLQRLPALDPPPEYLVLSGSLPPGVDKALYSRISRAMPPSCRVILDTSGASLQLGVEAGIFLVKPNIRELRELTGRIIEGDAQIGEAAETLIREKKAQVVVTSLGRAGVHLTTAEEHRHIRAPVVKIRSKVGAGDSMVAGIVLGLSRGDSIIEAVHLGVAAGAAAVMTEGTQLCRRDDTERLYNNMHRRSE